MTDFVRTRWLRTVGITLVVCTLLWTAPVGAQAPVVDFDGERAMAYAEHLSVTIGERAGGSDAEQRSVAWLATVLSNLGYAVEVQPFIFTRLGVENVGMNVVAVKEGQPDYGTLYIGAHHDTAFAPFNGPGANDNAAGIAVLLEAATVLASQEMTPTVTFIAFGVEELGMVGSGRYVNELSPLDRLTAIGMFNLDCVGIGDKLHIIARRDEHIAFAQSLDTDADSIRTSWEASDHIPFSWAGIPAVLFNMRYEDTHACGPNYHSSDDTLETLEIDALNRVGANLLTAIQGLGQEAEAQPVQELFLPLVSE